MDPTQQPSAAQPAGDQPSNTARPASAATAARRGPSTGRFVAWMIILALAGLTATLIYATGNHGPSTSSFAGYSHDAPLMTGDIALAPGTEAPGSVANGRSNAGNIDGSGEFSGIGNPNSGAVSGNPSPGALAPNTDVITAPLNLGEGINHDETRAYAGYTVSSGTVKSTDEDLQNMVHKAGGFVLNNTTDNQGGATILHAELTFVIPQDSVYTFFSNLPQDYQEYGKQISGGIDRSDAYAQAQHTLKVDQATLKTMSADDPNYTRVSEEKDKLQAAITASDNNQALSRVAIVLDERQSAPPSSLQSAWLLGTRNVIAAATGITYVALTGSPLLLIVVPLWMFRKRIRRAMQGPNQGAQPVGS